MVDRSRDCWKYVCPIVLLMMFGQGAMARQSAEPFDTLDLRVGLSRNVSSDQLLSSWNPGLSLSAGASTPFYAGSVNAGLRFESFSARSHDIPSFSSLYLRLGWGILWDGKQQSVHEFGTEIGNFFMVFDEDTFSGSRKESEIGLALYYHIRMRVSDRMGVFVRASYTHVLTNIRIDLFHITTGMVVRMKTPSWMKRILE